MTHHLRDVSDAAQALRVSKTFLYKLPRSTPGIYVFGRAVRYDVNELRAWAAARAANGPGDGGGR